MVVCRWTWPSHSRSTYSYSMPGPVNTWMGDRLRVCEPSRYVASHVGQLSLPSLRGRLIEYQPFWLGLGGARSLVSGGRKHCVIPYSRWRHVALRWVWLSMVLRLHQHNIGYTADGFYRSDDPTNSVRALKEGGSSSRQAWDGSFPRRRAKSFNLTFCWRLLRE